MSNWWSLTNDQKCPGDLFVRPFLQGSKVKERSNKGPNFNFNRFQKLMCQIVRLEPEIKSVHCDLFVWRMSGCLHRSNLLIEAILGIFPSRMLLWHVLQIQYSFVSGLKCVSLLKTFKSTLFVYFAETNLITCDLNWIQLCPRPWSWARVKWPR